MNFWDDLKRARFLGHPIHSMLVHFPSALFPISLIFDFISVITKTIYFSFASFYCIAAGLIIGTLAACIGVVDYIHISSAHTAWKKASLHAVLNIIWLIIFSIVFALKLKHYPQMIIATPAEIMLSTIAVIGLIFSNYLGGDLVFKHKIGIDDVK